MYKKITLVAFTVLLFSGCASVPMESTEKSDMVKKFRSPADGKAGLYIYRSGSFGAALKKDIWVDGKCIGESAPKVITTPPRLELPPVCQRPHCMCQEPEHAPGPIRHHRDGVSEGESD